MAAKGGGSKAAKHAAAAKPRSAKRSKPAKKGRPASKTAALPVPRAERKPGETRFWLMKSEPDAFSWDEQKARGAKGEPWTGVRNYLARNNMRDMRIGDLAFFYHSNEGLAVVGIVKVIAEAHPEPGDESSTWACVDVAAVCDVPQPVTLAAVKANPRLQGMSLVTSMRLSVQPVTADEWAEVCRMGRVDPAKLD